MTHQLEKKKHLWWYEHIKIVKKVGDRFDCNGRDRSKTPRRFAAA